MDVTGVIFTHLGDVVNAVAAIFAVRGWDVYARIHSKPAGHRGLRNGVYT